MRFFFHISFKGSRYCGWQRQIKGIPSVQEVIEQALQKSEGISIPVMGCGRTDAGVHASCFYAHVDVAACPDIHKLNLCLPDDIVVHAVIPVDEKSHARYDALSRTYTYRIHTQKDAFSFDLSYFYKREILFPELMQDACKWVVETRDFKAFCKTPDRHKSTMCSVLECSWKFDFGSGKHSFQIKANRFLKSMVRILVHDMLALGEGKLSADEFKRCLGGERNKQIHRIAYPQGLYLTHVDYSYILEKINKDFCNF